jgi:hypothetical protein
MKDFLKGKKVASVVEGSRAFRPPAALGEMVYEGCEIAVFDSHATLHGDSFIKDAAASAVRFERIYGLAIAVFEEPSEDDIWTTFVSFPRTNVMLVASNMDYLRSVLAKMQHAGRPVALPESLPEWKYVKTRSASVGRTPLRQTPGKL